MSTPDPTRFPPWMRVPVRRFRDSVGRPESRALLLTRLALVVVLWILVSHAIDGVKPWETKWAERVAEGKRPGLLDYIRAGTWVATVINAGIAAILLATSGLWCRTTRIPRWRLLQPAESEGRAGETSSTTRRRPWLFRILFLAVIVIAAVPRIARLDHSLWGDEEWAFREFVHGEFVPEDPDDPLGPLTFRPTTWRQAFFLDPNGNNHYLFSVLQHAVHSVWRGVSGVERQVFSEPVARLVPFAAGMALLVVIGLFTRRLAGPGAALLAVAFAAAHPMHIRYASEARGYSLIALVILLLIWATIRALDRGRWRDWALVGLLSLVGMHTWKASAHPIALIQLVALAHIIVRRPGPAPGSGWRAWKASEKGLQLTRLVVANAFAAAIFIQLFAPCHPQIQAALQTSMLQGLPMDMGWFLGSLCRIAYGFQYIREDPQNPVQVAFQSLAPLHRAGAWLVAAGLIASAVVGFRTFFRQSPWPALLLAAPVAVLPLAWAHFRFGPGVEFRYWYQIYGYASFFILVSIGLVTMGRGLGRLISQSSAGAAEGRATPNDALRRALVGLPSVLVLGLFVAVSLPQTMMLVRHPFEDFRRAAELTRGRVEDRYFTGRSRILTLNYWRSAPLYDPRFDTHARSPEALQAVIDRARREDLDLFVTIGMARFNATFFPEVHRIITESGQFEKLADLWAEHTMFTLHVYRLLPAQTTAPPQ